MFSYDTHFVSSRKEYRKLCCEVVRKEKLINSDHLNENSKAFEVFHI